jgi:hypothetical protein
LEYSSSKHKFWFDLVLKTRPIQSQVTQSVTSS